MEEFENFDSITPSSATDSIRVSNAVIQDIAFEGNTSYVTITYTTCPRCSEPEEVVRLVVNRNTVIRNEAGRSIPAGELQSGMIVHAVFSSAMTRSLPPQAQAFRIQVVQRPQSHLQTTGRIIEVNPGTQSLLIISNGGSSSMIRFNIAPNTIILDPFGRRISLNNLLPGLRVRIWHASFMTASIPPQTTAHRIQIIR